jgi:hypothetical protein
MKQEVKLDDIVSGTDFRYQGKKYRKGTATGGKKGGTWCQPYAGGKLQPSSAFAQQVPNNAIVEVDFD